MARPTFETEYLGRRMDRDDGEQYRRSLGLHRCGNFCGRPNAAVFNRRRDRLSVLDAEMAITSLELAKYLEKFGVRRLDAASPGVDTT